MVKLPTFNSSTGRAKAAAQGQAGFDNPRENIDPHVKTKVISTKEIMSGAEVLGKLVVRGTLSGGTIVGANVTSGVDPGHTHTAYHLSGTNLVAPSLSGGQIYSSGGFTGAGAFLTFVISGGLVLSAT